MVLVGGVLAMLGGCAAHRPVNPHAEMLKTFQDGLDQYVAQRQAIERTLPPLKQTPVPDDLKGRQEALREAMRKARASLGQGNLVTPDVAAIIRDAVHDDFAERSTSTQRAAREEVPPSPERVPEVNSEYPIAKALPTVPPKLLALLPPLPNVLEYRFLGRSVVLRDVDTNLIVDVVPIVLPPKTQNEERGRWNADE